MIFAQIPTPTCNMCDTCDIDLIIGKKKIIGTLDPTSVLDLLAASCRGVNCHRSIAFTFAPWVISNSVT